jgi:UDP-N-acetylmuramyl pentapeptide phosphotransferase/UDP-N-acetylglucosamine-1-phosphate transferase
MRIEVSLGSFLDGFTSAVSVADKAMIFGGVTCFAVCLTLLLTQRWHGAISNDFQLGVQKFHEKPTPRVGGVAILIGLIIGWLFSPSELRALMQPMLLAAAPAFLLGLLEDLTKRVGVLERLSACFFSGALAWWITGLGVDRIGIVYLDNLLSFPIIVFLFTSFAIAGICNAVNMIDGFNGLCSGTVIIGVTAIAFIGYAAGDTTVAKLSIISACTFFGFFLLNFPFGKLFLGDCGAYLMGFWLGWLSILLISRNPSVTPFVALLVCAPPLVEALASIFRRLVSGQRISDADDKHLHSLIKTQLISRLLINQKLLVRNSLVSVLLLPLALIPSCMALLSWDNTGMSATGFIAVLVGYGVFYQVLVRLR